MTVGIVFCTYCGSHRIDVNGWHNGQAQFRCYQCGNETMVSGFTIGRWDNEPQGVLPEAIKDLAGIETQWKLRRAK